MSGAIQAQGAVSAFTSTPAVLLGSLSSVPIIFGSTGGVVGALKLASNTLTSCSGTGAVRTTLDNGSGAMTVGGGITSTAAANSFGASTIGAITNTSNNTFGKVVTSSTGTTGNNDLSAFLRPTLNTGNTTAIQVGVTENSTNNAAVFGFSNSSGTGSTANQAVMGLFGALGQLTVDGNGNVTMPGTLLTASTLTIGNNAVITSGGATALTTPATSGTLALTSSNVAFSTGTASITAGSAVIGSTTITTGGSVSVALPSISGTLALLSPHYLGYASLGGSVTWNTVANNGFTLTNSSQDISFPLIVGAYNVCFTVTVTGVPAAGATSITFAESGTLTSQGSLTLVMTNGATTAQNLTGTLNIVVVTTGAAASIQYSTSNGVGTLANIQVYISPFF